MITSCNYCNDITIIFISLQTIRTEVALKWGDIGSLLGTLFILKNEAWSILPYRVIHFTS